MIEAIDRDKLAGVLPLIRNYLEFYQVANIDDARNREFFSRFGPDSKEGCQFAYRKDNKLVAFATVYFSYASSVLGKVAIMNDLYTDKDYRRQGIATQLIKHCEKYAKERGAVRLQWLTASSNSDAQSVYRQLGAKQSSWEFFSYSST